MDAYGRCHDCASPDPQHRTAHQFFLTRTGGLDELRAHLTEQYVTLRDKGRDRPDAVNDICHWMANVMEQYSGMAHPDTGAAMPWWEARRYMGEQRDAIAQMAHDRKPEKAHFAAQPPDVPGFARVERMPQGTAFAEEAAYAGVTRIQELDEEDYTPGFGE